MNKIIINYRLIFIEIRLIFNIRYIMGGCVTTNHADKNAVEKKFSN